MSSLHLVDPVPAASADALAAEYCELCGMNRLPWMRPAFVELLREGFEPKLLSMAILKTAQAPRPSWAYLQAIIKNCRSYGVYYAEDFQHQKPPRKKYDQEQDY